jgi:hypothetical protein
MNSGELFRRPAPVAWRQVAAITAGALGLYAFLRLLPTGTNLSHMDFRIDPKAGNSLEFCDPLEPQFIPVVAVRSPVAMTLATSGPAVAGREVRAVVALRTAGGKPIAPEDLLVTHTRRLHLLLIDPTLSDYQHVHPAPGRRPGEWDFRFTPVRAGLYRIFGDFTPAATGRGLYASADLPVAPVGATPAAAVGPPAPEPAAARVEPRGYRFDLTVTPQPVRAGRPLELGFALERLDGGLVALEPIMGARAHLVAFDRARSGFAHLHPAEPEGPHLPAEPKPVLKFKLTIPRAGSFVVWAQVNLGGREEFARFDLEVVE